MARKRMIDPEFFLDEELAKLSAHARLLYIASWSICDDNYHTFPNRPEWIKTQTLPYESVSIPDLLKELEVAGKIIPFEAEGKGFYFIKNFGKYQRVEKPSAPKYPRFDVVLPDYSPTTPAEEKRREEKRRDPPVRADAHTTEEFESFWSAYPRKIRKKDARKVWDRVFRNGAVLSEVNAGLEKWKKSRQWVKDGGQFIPHPTTWLNGERWKDEVDPPKVTRHDVFGK